MGIALRIIRSPIEAEDVLQDVFWQLWRSELRYDPERGRFTTWLFAVARNRALDRARQLGRLSQRTTFAEPLQDDGHGPEEDTAFSERRRAVRLALASLTPEQRRTIELAFFEGLTHREIADRVAEPLGTVKSRIKRGMEKLKELLVDHGART